MLSLLTPTQSHREELPHFHRHVYKGKTTDVPRAFHETRWSAPLSTALFGNRHGKQEPSHAPKTPFVDTCEGSSISLQKEIRLHDQGQRILGVVWRHARVVEGQVGSGYPETGNLRQLQKVEPNGWALWVSGRLPIKWFFKSVCYVCVKIDSA